MPRYDYFCENCNIEYVIRHSITDDDDKFCSSCESVLKKQLSRNFNIKVNNKTNSVSEKKESIVREAEEDLKNFKEELKK